jgi:hypothetical protein
LLIASAGCTSTRDKNVELARNAFEGQLHVTSSTVVGYVDGDGKECAAVALRAPDGRERRVALILQGSPAKWDVLKVSERYQLSDYKNDGDALCGLYPVDPVASRPATILVVVNDTGEAVTVGLYDDFHQSPPGEASYLPLREDAPEPNHVIIRRPGKPDACFVPPWPTPAPKDVKVHLHASQASSAYC